ncbi:nose resistant to fluoxetine protein 6-like [Pomacea canaliculata]|uniref:nose resistant to fluoxetine protein 6-like n=1 Tax=Pomacea canaliculata TaxID=400727 RepID=UPI000D73A7A1|nr:nose resistant to fluoxetine protein 6-like [Pomacea canaliculata]XP_025112801.1 nose resistant to fluoxetine protein 6-like [Pomacea canaliculata]XP_025112802.1 nose resistant to fluoxetine protein 6-like [Pomacea canaliculata]XP_025112803.1 nose resistant to fluoxetine protein 6-like [Pomacea canaliculata]XP_025112804.1 nose resistant to fluoxetine protein 6-like [Pomacea canaliculata]
MVIGTLIDIVAIQMPKWRSQEMDSLGINSVFENVPEEEKPLLLGFKTGIASPEPGLIVQILVSFSVYTNGSKLLSTTQSHNNLACLHGIRFFSMTWVVLGHTFITPLGAASNFYSYYMEVQDRWSFLAISNAVFSVDTFFVLSGLLVAFLSLKEMKRCAGRLNWAIFYLHRFWRLTPPYMLILLLYVCLGPYWGSGPMWPDKQPDRDNCKMSWWTNLLYINNFVDLDNSCMGFTWYLANDMQFYILSPLIFVPFYYSVKYGMIAYGIFLTATVVTPACLTVADHLPASLFTAGTQGVVEKYQHELYIKPYTRMGPYIVGMVTGYLLYHYNCRIQINKILNLFGWIVATAVGLAVVYGLYDDFEGHI